MTIANAGNEKTQSSGWPFARNLIDILVLAAFTFAVSFGLEAYAPAQKPFDLLVPLWSQPIAVVLFIGVLLRIAGHRFRDIGLGPITNLTSTALQGIVIAVVLFAISAATEAMGFERDFTSIRKLLDGQPLNLLFLVIYAFIGAGLYEEATFRGFALDRVARMFGQTRAAWAIAAVVQGALFGLAHAHQGQYAILYTGVLGTLFASILLVNGRNLWALVLGHGLYDASRFIYLYWLWSQQP